MKLVNWIFGSAIMLLLIVIIYEAANTETVQGWLNSLSADAPVVARTAAGPDPDNNSEQTSTAITQPAPAVPVSLPDSLRAATPVTNAASLQSAPQQTLHAPAATRVALEDSLRNVVSSFRQVKASKPGYEAEQSSYRIKNPADQIRPRTKELASPPPSTRVANEPPPVVYQTPYNSRTFKTAPNNNTPAPAPAASNYAPPKPVPAAAANEVESAGSFSRKFSQSEINEFVSQYPDRSINIRFVHFGVLEAEMETVKSQIIDELVKKGYREINRGWATMNGYTATDDVHFGMNGPRGVNFYIPALPKK
ncbi:MAG TPA: hypothetical protein VJ552_11560 [Sediminibacterium sp.]|nr:hypothetical protein [Sediminibacterium sp.]